MASVFLSYDRGDADRARHFAQALEKSGHDVWWDLHIKTGAQYTKEIDRALKEANAVVVLWSERSVESPWVRDEAAAGRDSGRLVPVTLDGTEPPLGFRQFQTIDLSQWKGRGKPAQLKVLLDDVAAMGAAETPAGEHRRAETTTNRKHAFAPAREPVSRRTLIIGGAGVAILAAGGATLAWQQRWFGSAKVNDHSIAVLPFKNLGGDPAHTYLSEGITEEIRAALKRIPALHVLAATSSNIAAESGEDTVGIARKLGVAFLLEGSVQLAGKTLRIGVDLTEGRTGFSKWSEQVDRPLADIFAVQREIAESVASVMAARIATARPEAGGTPNLSAYQYYLRGRRAFLASAGPSDNRAALTLLDLAVAADPHFAKAHAMRSRALTRLGGESGVPTEARSYKDHGLQAAIYAVTLAPRLADAHVALSFARSTRLDFKAAMESIDRAVELAPGDADVLRTYSGQMLNLGEIEGARRAATKSAALDPLNDRAYVMLGDIEFAALQYRTAIGHFEKAGSLNPESRFINSRLAQCLIFLGENDDALAEAEKEGAPWLRHMLLAVIRRKLGDRSGAVREFETLKEAGPLVSYQEAQVLAQWGDIQAAIGALERAVEAGDPGITQAKMDPFLIPLHRHPAYEAILRKVGLT